MYPSVRAHNCYRIILGTFLWLWAAPGPALTQTKQLTCFSDSTLTTLYRTPNMSTTISPVCDNDVHIENTVSCLYIPCSLPKSNHNFHVLPASTCLRWSSKVNASKVTVTPPRFGESTDRPDHYYIGNSNCGSKRCSKEASREGAAFFYLNNPNHLFGGSY